ncbi:MAG: hypothetical protein AAF556_12335 [Pseudomonadota bacterium]
MLAQFLRKPTTVEVALETAALINTDTDIAALARGQDVAKAARQQTDRIRYALLRSGMVVGSDTRDFLAAAYKAFQRLGEGADNADFQRLREPLRSVAAQIEDRALSSSPEGRQHGDPRLLYVAPADTMDELYFRYLMHKPDPNSLTATIAGLALSDDPVLPNPTNMPEGVVASEFVRRIRNSLTETGAVMDGDARQLLIKAHNVLARLADQPSRLAADVPANAPPGMQFTGHPNPAWRHDFQQSFAELRPDAIKVQERMMAQLGATDAVSGVAGASPASGPPRLG